MVVAAAEDSRFLLTSQIIVFALQGDDFASRNKKYDFTGCDPMGDLPFDYHLELLKLSGSGEFVTCLFTLYSSSVVIETGRFVLEISLSIEVLLAAS